MNNRKKEEINNRFQKFRRFLEIKYNSWNYFCFFLNKRSFISFNSQLFLHIRIFFLIETINNRLILRERKKQDGIRLIHLINNLIIFKRIKRR